MNIKAVFEHLQGISSVLGCFIFMTIAGNIITWGSIYSYVTSFLLSVDDSVTSSQVYLSSPLSYLTELLGVMLAPVLSKRFGTRVCLLLGGLVMGSGFIIMSRTNDVRVLVGSYSLLFGTGAGIVTSTAMRPAWEHFPRNKGTVGGLVMAGYSLAPMIVGVLFTYLVNPQNAKPIPFAHSVKFPSEVNDQVPDSLFIVGVLFMVQSVVGTLLIRPANNSRKPEGDSTQLQIPVASILKNKEFWAFSFMAFAIFFFWYFFVGMYKTFALVFIDDDHFVTYVGSFANVVGAFGRWLWPTLLDYFPYKPVMTACVGYQLFITLTLYFVVSNKYLYAVSIITLFFCTAGMFPSLAVLTEKFFKKAAQQVWPFVFLGVSLTSGTSIALNYLAEAYGYVPVFSLSSVVLAFSLFLIWKIREDQFTLDKSLDEAFEPLLEQV